MNTERYVRQHIYGAAHRATVGAAGGLIPLVEAELRELAAELLTPGRPGFEITERDGRIELGGVDYRTLVELTLRLTTAHDLRLEISRGKAGGRRELEGLLRAVPWEVYLPRGARIEVRADSRGSRLYHEGLIEECTTVALTEAGLVAANLLPTEEGGAAEAGPAPRAGGDSSRASGRPRLSRPAGADADFRLTVRLESNRVRIELSLVGAPLWRRGYRASFDARAPLREDLAQGAVRSALSFAAGVEEAASPPSFDTLLIPFAGSGTLLFESLIARFGIAPCLFGRSYAFERFAFGAPPSAAWLKERLAKAIAERFASTGRLQAVLIDSHAGAIRAARENLASFERLLRAAGPLPLHCAFRESDVFAAPWSAQLPPAAASLFVPLNPPYGHRLAVGSVDHLYQRIGESLERLAGDLAVTAALRAGDAGGVGRGRGARLERGEGTPRRISGFVLCPTEGAWRRFQNATPAFRKRTLHLGQGGLDIRLCLFAVDPASRK